MDTAINKKSFGTNIVDFFKNIVIGFISIFSYAFKGAKACTFDLMVFIYNSISFIVQSMSQTIEKLKKKKYINIAREPWLN